MVTALGLAVAAGAGSYFLYTAVALGWTGWQHRPRRADAVVRRPARDWLIQAGLAGTSPLQVAAVVATLFAVGATVAYTVFGGVLGPLAAGTFAATFPLASYRNRRRARRDAARDAWPRMIEEMRLHTGALGRSVPQSLFEVGRHAPDDLRPAFAAAHREWLLTTDFDKAAGVLKAGLVDPTADLVCETLVVAHQLGGADLDRRLAALAEDRWTDAHHRKDARAKQAGVRFARRFVLLVPAGMALAGMTVGDGRQAYATPHGQVAVAAGVAMVAVCWAWAGRVLRLPDERRVLPT